VRSVGDGAEGPLSEVPDVDLAAVEAAVQDAIVRGDESGLRLLGHGEISLVVGWPADRPVVACKRLPPFRSPAAANDYGGGFAEYLDVLVERGVNLVPSRFEAIDGTSASTVAYVVQPVLEPDQLGTAVLRATEPDPDHPVVLGVLEAVGRVCDERTGLDAQLSNWAWTGGGLRYLDVTTPMLFDAHGRVCLDLDLFLAAYPWALRWPIGRFVAPGVVGEYRDPRHVVVDLAANLLKERLEAWIPAVLDAVNAVVVSAGSPVVTEDEVRRYYRSDARLWEVMLRLRRADRWWQRRVRRRTYPFLLPGHIDR